MTKLNHILFPMDFSERCCSAVPFVDSMARRHNAKITLLSVSEAFYYAAFGDPSAPIVVNFELVLDDLKNKLEGALAGEFKGICVERVAEVGDPSQLITDFAETHGAGLIMMPTHGYGPFRRLLLGSVTAKVLHDAKCPVWTAAHTTEMSSAAHAACRSVLCAVDGAPENVSLIRWAGEFAKDAGASLRLVHVIPGMQGIPSRQMDSEFEADMQQQAKDTIARFQETAGFSAPVSIMAGSVVDEVCEEAVRSAADLVVIGRGAIRENLGRLRAHAYGIIRQSPCPVLSV